MATIKDALEQLKGADRVNYATGMLLGAEDFQAEQQYHRGRLARALAYTMGYGTLAGLEVDWAPAQEASGDTPARSERLMVAPGLAIDRLGRMIEVGGSRCLLFDRWYQATSSEALRLAWHPAEALWTGSPAGVAADLFIRFVVCSGEKTPAFSDEAGASFDSIVDGRLSDGCDMGLILRQESKPALPQSPWPDFASDATNLRNAIFSAWQEGTAYASGQELEPLAEHVAGQGRADLFLARLLIPADQGPIGGRPTRRLAEAVVVRNDLRPLVVTAGALARWLGIAVTANP